MRKHQQEMVDFALSRHGANWFASPGLGKTLAALTVIQETDLPALVVAPALTCKVTWPDEIRRWGFDCTHRFLHGKNKHLDDLPDVSFINYEGLPWLAGAMKKNPFKLVVCDEVSKMKHPGSLRFRRMRKHMPSFKYRLGMTGSPVGNRLEDVWGEQYCVDLGASLGTAKGSFLLEYFVQIREHQWVPRPGAKAKIFDLMKGTAKSWGLDLLDMPSLVHNNIKIEMPAKARAWYDELRDDDTIAELDLIADNVLVKSLKQKQLANGRVYDPYGHAVKIHKAKIDRVAMLLDELQGDPTLLCYEYKTDCDALSELFEKRSTRYRFIHGETTDDETSIRMWQNGELDVLAFHPQAVSHGLNLQHGGSTLIFYTVPWSLELVEQITGRLWRQGQTRPVVVHYLTIADTIDETILEKVDEKESVQDEAFASLK